jgi:hypothetical protein
MRREGAWSCRQESGEWNKSDGLTCVMNDTIFRAEAQRARRGRDATQSERTAVINRSRMGSALLRFPAARELNRQMLDFLAIRIDSEHLDAKMVVVDTLEYALHLLR